ncbi:MAG: hypothetical protein H6R35_758, partial [Bacteroidetes bacterium]|nr:hypothetical protein [Bacteroidota bacterium]
RGKGWVKKAQGKKSSALRSALCALLHANEFVYDIVYILP